MAPLAAVAMLLIFAAASSSAAGLPVVTPGVTIPSDTANTFATLGGTINPNGEATTYHFEYGKTSAYGDSAPAVDASAGSGTINIIVTRAISELELNTVYHYRLVAKNASGTTNGPDLTLQTGPNLGFGMHYEFVSPSDTNGSPTSPKKMALDGSRINMFVGAQGFGDTESQHGLVDTYVASRTPTGWVTNAMTPPQNPTLDNRAGATFDTTPDLSTQLVYTASLEEMLKGSGTYRLLQPGNLNYAAFPLMTDVSGQSKESANIIFALGGTSEDLNHLLAATAEGTRLLPTDPVKTGTKAATYFNTYEITRSPPSIRRVTLNSNGEEMALVCGSSGAGGYQVSGSLQGRSENSVSADGSKAFFATIPGTPSGQCSAEPERQYVRINGSETIELSVSECSPACATPQSNAAFAGATNDGSAAFFSTVQQLVNADLDTTRDLYRYDFAKPAGQHLSLVSKGEVTPGNGAQVKNVVQVSPDGARAYFVAGGILASNLNSYGQTAQAGANNLYVYERGSDKTRFIARLDAFDSSMWGETYSSGFELPDDSGRWALLGTFAQLSPGDTDTSMDLYRYDAQANELLKVTPGNSVTPYISVQGPNGGLSGPPALAISADGSAVVFETPVSLQAADENGVADVYLWKDGSVGMISDGRSLRGSKTLSYMVSSDGQQVAFATATSLLPKDANSQMGTYVARTGADVEPPTIVPPPPCASSELCRGATPPAPVQPGPSTPSFVWPGNDPTPAPTAKPKKKKHHKGKKKKQQKHRAHRQATRQAG
jgi:hypothetical protein